MRRLGAPFVLITLLLAGCAASDGGPPAGSDGTGPVASGEPIPDAATISGLVVDDSQSPVEGALVAIVGLSLQAQTGAGGAFQFANVPPGPHDVSAVKLGYASTAKRVEVAANQHLDGVLLVLLPIVIETVYHDVIGPISGYFECYFGSPTTVTPCTGDTFLHQVSPDLNPSQTVFPNDKRRFEFMMSADHWATMVGESRWTPPAAATGAGMAIYPSFKERPDSHWWCEADGQSPLRFRYEAQDVDLDNGLSVCTSQSNDHKPLPSMALNPLIIAADAGFGTFDDAERPPFRLLYQQRFEIMITMFYGEPAPADYTALADA